MVPVAHRQVDVDGSSIFYRESDAPAGAPTLLLLHGFPSGSHQFRRLMDALGGRFRMIAPDYPGFGYSDSLPSGASFEALADAMEGFCRAIGLDRFALYAFDFGAPVGFRLATRHPDWIAGLVVQNGLVHEAGLSPFAREFTALRRELEGAEARVRELLTLDATRDQYLHGAADPEAVAPGRVDARPPLPRAARAQGHPGRPGLRLPQQPRALPGVAGVAARAPPADARRLGPQRPVLRRGRSLGFQTGGPSRGGARARHGALRTQERLTTSRRVSRRSWSAPGSPLRCGDPAQRPRQ